MDPTFKPLSQVEILPAPIKGVRINY